MSEVLKVDLRTETGKRNNRRLRRGGRLPAVLYGTDEEALTLSVAEDALETSLRHGARVVDLAGAATGQAFLQEVQWDTFGYHVLHIDLLRVKAGQAIRLEVPVEMRGEAPGINEGGAVEQLLHRVEIEVTPADMPDKLHVNVNGLGLNESLLVSDIEDLPASAKMLTDPSQQIVQCMVPIAAPEEEEEFAGPAEPEVIGQKDDEEGEQQGS